MSILLEWIGAITVAAGVLASFAYWLFKLFSDKWLTAKFAERLEDYRHSQQKELENLRFEINKLMDRSTKLHQREFNALPETWALLVEAHGITRAVVSPFQQHADVGRMDTAKLDEFLENSPFENWQKEQIKLTENKNEYYFKALSWHRNSEARSAAQEFHIHRLKHCIFMLPEIYEKLERMDDLIFKAINEHAYQLEQDSGIRRGDAQKKLDSDGAKLMKELEVDIRGRLSS